MWQNKRSITLKVIFLIAILGIEFSCPNALVYSLDTKVNIQASINTLAPAEPIRDPKARTARQNRLQLQDGDRVVFLGNSLMEDDQDFGYIELALTTRWPDSDVTYRNLGWEGDTVFGKARSYYASTPNLYELMIKQLKDAKPDVVFVAYGAVESYKGEEGLPHFKKGLNQLLDKIDSIGARAVLLSPLPQMATPSSVKDMASHNKDLKLYTSAISQTASRRDLRFIDLFTPVKKISNNVKLTTDGIHLNEIGYYYLTSLIESGLGLAPRKWVINVDISKKTIEAKGAQISALDIANGQTKFKVQDNYLPLPTPPLTQNYDVRLPPLTQKFKDSLPPLIKKEAAGARKIRIRGLDKGCYRLLVDGLQVAAASARKWEDGVIIHDGTSFRQSELLRYKILEKNKFFFHQYRPQNRVYIIGYRNYAPWSDEYREDLKKMDLFIRMFEQQAAHLRVPQKNTYKLVPVE